MSCPFGLSGGRWRVFAKVRKSHERAGWGWGGLGAFSSVGRRSPEAGRQLSADRGNNPALGMKVCFSNILTRDLNFCHLNIQVLTFHLKQLPEKLKAVRVHSGRMKSPAGKSDQNLIAQTTSGVLNTADETESCEGRMLSAERAELAWPAVCLDMCVAGPAGLLLYEMKPCFSPCLMYLEYTTGALRGCGCHLIRDGSQRPSGCCVP